eukprot:707366-Hanusia_phi.AAC.5
MLLVFLNQQCHNDGGKDQVNTPLHASYIVMRTLLRSSFLLLSLCFPRSLVSLEQLSHTIVRAAHALSYDTNCRLSKPS